MTGDKRFAERAAARLSSYYANDMPQTGGDPDAARLSPEWLMMAPRAVRASLAASPAWNAIESAAKFGVARAVRIWFPDAAVESGIESGLITRAAWRR